MMSTARWENVRPVEDPLRKWTGAEFIENVSGMLDDEACEVYLTEQETRNSEHAADMRDAAIADLRNQLEEARADRDRYIARVKHLEQVIDQARKVLK